MDPLKLAAVEGSIDMFEAILEIDGVYRVSETHLGHAKILQYDVADIEPILCRYRKVPSVLEIFAYTTEDEKSTIAFKIPLLLKLIDLKWRHYKYYYLVWAIVHCIYMICLTGLSLGVTETHYRVNFENCSNESIKKTSNSIFRDKLGLPIVIMCNILLIYGITGLICHIRVYLRRTKQFQNTFSFAKITEYFLFLIGESKLVNGKTDFFPANLNM